MAYFRLYKQPEMTNAEHNRLLIDLGSDVGIRDEKTDEIFVWLPDGMIPPWDAAGGPFLTNQAAITDLRTETGWNIA